METKLLTPVKTPEDIHAELVLASMEWVDLRDRSGRCGDRDAQLLARRDAVMENICGKNGLLDQFVVINELQGVEGGAS